MWWLAFAATVLLLAVAGSVIGVLVHPAEAISYPLPLLWLVDGATTPLTWAVAGMAVALRWSNSAASRNAVAMSGVPHSGVTRGGRSRRC